MKKYLFLNMFWLVLMQEAFTQNCNIVGKVSDEKGQGVSYVNIELKEISKGIISNEKGEFSFSNLKAKKYTLVASYVGYKTLTQKIVLEDGKTLTLLLELKESSELLKEIIIKGSLSQNERIVSIGKIPIRAMDLPQSVMSIDSKIIQNQQVNNLSDIVANTNGIYVMGATGGIQEEIAGRGFSFGSNNTFKNGVRFFNGMLTETSGLEKVEIMKGSSAILFGNVAAGGILNLITKKPKFDFGGEGCLKIGSFGLIKPSFDIYSGIGKKNKAAFRINSSYQKAESFREGVSSERFYINPSLIVNFGKKTSLLIEGDYTNDIRTPDYGAGIVNYQIVNIPREQFLGIAWSNFKAKQISTNFNLNHKFSKNWTLSIQSGIREYSTSLFSNSRPNSGTLINSKGDWIRNVQKTEVADNYRMITMDLKGNFLTGGIQHQFLTGFDAEGFKTFTSSFNQIARYDTINIFNPTLYKRRTDIPSPILSSITTVPVKRAGVYVQDLVHLAKWMKLLAGLRYTYQESLSNVLTVSSQKQTASSNYDGAFSPRFGLVIQPNSFQSFFASYSNSFNLNTGVDTTGKALKPSLIDQYEIGLKNELLKGKVSANGTLYKIIYDNLAQTSLVNGNTNSNIKELAGTVESKGAEIDLSSRPIIGLYLMAGYSYNITKYTKSNTYIEGSQLRYNPNHTANLSFNYDFEKKLFKGLGIGATSVYIGKRYAGRSTRITVENDSYRLIALPSYVQVDGNVSYRYKKMLVRAKIGNIFDVLSYNVHDDNSVNPIAPRNYSLNLEWHF